MNRQRFTTLNSISHIWETLKLPKEALGSLHLVEDGDFLPSSFKLGHLAQASIALSALTASLFWSARTSSPVPRVTISMKHACVEFSSDRLCTLNSKRLGPALPPIGGLHKTADGYVRMHDSFLNHRVSALKILGLQDGANREEVAAKMLEWKSVELESAAFENGAVIVALRSFDEWDALPQAKAVVDFPITVRKINTALSHVPPSSAPLLKDKCLRGIRVVEMSRVISAPVAGKTLAAHGADVIWVTSPTLPDLPEIDRDMARGKRTVQLDIKKAEDKEKLIELLRTAHVFISSYRPGSLAAQGLSAEELTKINPNLIVATLNAWGENGPWSMNRGFDSLVQAASGINVAEAESYGEGEPARVLPTQALDHGSGYLLATGIMAALYERELYGGAYEVHVSLAGVMKYLRSLGRFPGKDGFERKSVNNLEHVEKIMETRGTEFGELRAVKHTAVIEGVDVGWEIMPKPLGSDEAAWLSYRNFLR
ncbi:hypothetical protein N0V90_007799 [Kalmusia sp. IMI 367209]|nr:hypothetical protein N0V90_007799 [Kalmusia sp. IMI 367209]